MKLYFTATRVPHAGSRSSGRPCRLGWPDWGIASHKQFMHWQAARFLHLPQSCLKSFSFSGFATSHPNHMTLESEVDNVYRILIIESSSANRVHDPAQIRFAHWSWKRKRVRWLRRNHCLGCLRYWPAPHARSFACLPVRRIPFATPLCQSKTPGMRGGNDARESTLCANTDSTSLFLPEPLACLK